MKNEMSDEEWGAFLNKIPSGTVAPFGSYDEYLIKQGVIEQDIRFWNELGRLEQEKIKEETQDSCLRIMMFFHTHENKTPRDAAIHFYDNLATFADYPFAQGKINELNNLGYVNEEDYPLPWELKNRVDLFGETLMNDPIKSKEVELLFKPATSANAATRKLIRDGII